MITIVDAGIGNLQSVANMFNFIGIDTRILKEPTDISNITHLVLPGVGSFDTGISMLEQTGWREAIEKIQPRIKLLGICLGMQLLTESSEEGKREGLGFIKASCSSFDTGLVTVPHVGWNRVSITRKNNLIDFDGSEKRFYFSHSFYVKSNDLELQTMQSEYGTNFIAGYEKGDVYGVQFHPEKSHKFGMEIFKNFANL